VSQKSNTVASLTIAHAPVFDLDPAKVGNVLLRLGAISCNLDHTTIRGTVTPYCQHPDELSPEARFVVDMLSGRPVSQLVDRWYGGERNAQRIGARLLPRRSRDRRS
jgi:hypothetical protein